MKDRDRSKLIEIPDSEALKGFSTDALSLTLKDAEYAGIQTVRITAGGESSK